jgi:hypothetical protein
MSCCTTTVSNSVRNNAPVGQASRQAALAQCLQTSLIINQLLWNGGILVTRSTCSTNATWRQVVADSALVLS